MAGDADISTRRLEPVGGVAPRSIDELRKDILAASGIFLFAFALYLLPAARERPLTEHPEARIAVVAREMLRTGDYVVPSVGGGEARLNKPPLSYWLAAGSARLLSNGTPPKPATLARAIVLPPALLGALTLLIVVLYGCAVFGRPAGVTAGLVLGFCVMVCHYAQLGYADTTLLFTTAGMFCSAAWLTATPRPGVLTALWLGASLGLGILTKGHVPALLLAAPVLVEVLIRRSFSGRKVLLFVVALVIAAAIAIPWFVLVEERSPGAWKAMLGEAKQNIATTGHVQSDRWWYYFYHLAGGLLPWAILLAVAWPLYLARGRGKAASSPLPPGEGEKNSGVAVLAREQLRFFVLSFCLGFIVFYAVPRQQEYYLLPLLPALALASGYVVSQFKFPGGMAEEDLAWSQLALGLLAAVFVATLPLWPSHCFVDTETSAAHVGLLFGPKGWAITAPAALAIFLVHFFSARQLVEGKPLTAAIAIAVLTYCVLAGWSWYATGREQRDSVIHAEATSLCTQLRGMDPDVRIYSAGVPEALLTFYLERPVHTQKELAAETAAGAVPRVLVVRRTGVLQIESAYDIKVSAEELDSRRQILLLPLPPGEDWPAKAAAAIQARVRKHTK